MWKMYVKTQHIIYSKYYIITYYAISYAHFFIHVININYHPSTNGLGLGNKPR